MSDSKPPPDSSGGGGGGDGNSADNEASKEQVSTTTKVVITVVVVIAISLAISAGLVFSSRTVFGKAADEEKIVDELENIEEDLDDIHIHHHRHHWKPRPHPPPEEKPGQCPPSDGFGISVHECSNDHECDGSKKCCAVGGGAGQMCQEPIFVDPAEKPGHCPPSNGFGMHDCSNDYDCRGSSKCCAIGGGAGQMCKEPVWEKPGQCPHSHGFGITVHECSTDFECGGSKKCCAVGGGTGQMCKEPDFFGQASPMPSPVMPGTNLVDCPGWDEVWLHTSAVCYASMAAAKLILSDKCSYYKDFLKCMSFIMRTMNYHCSEQDLQQMAETHHRDLYARKPGTLDTAYHAGSGSDWHNPGSSSYYGSGRSDTYSSGSSKYYGSDGSSWLHSSSGHYDGSHWPSSSSSSYYSSDYYGRGSHQWGSRSSSDDSWAVSPSYSDSMYSAASAHQDHSFGYPAPMSHVSQQTWSLPDTCKNYVVPSLVDMVTTEPCENPDAYVYLLKYHCRNESSHVYHKRRRRDIFGFHRATTASLPTSPSTDTSNACLVLFQKAQCIRAHFKEIKLTCSSSTILDTIENHKHSVLTTEVDQCSDARDKLRTDGCYQAIIADQATCLHKLHNTKSEEKACSMFKATVKCIKQSYPYQCGRKHASQVLRQWLSAAGVKRELTSSLGIDLNCDSLRLFTQCSSSKVKLTPDRAVLMQVQGKWARVCADGWNDTDAQVVCRSKGFNVGYASRLYDGMSYNDVQGTQVEGRILNMSCTGREKSPVDCPYMKGHGCPSGRMGGAVCYKSAPVYEIVSDKEDTPYGYVRRTADGRSAFVTTSWTNDMAADLFCKAAGYPDGGILFTRNLPTNIDMGYFRWHLDSLYCESEDTTIEACAARVIWKYGNSHIMQEHYYGSMGYTTPENLTPIKVFCFAGEVRLHNGLLNSTGIAQALSTQGENQYVGICRHDFTNFTASLFCRALGLGFQSGQAVGYQPFTYMTSTSPYVKFTCRGYESKLSECQNQTMWYWVGDGFAVVKCTPPLVSETVPEMTVKLDYDNRTVLVYKNHQWGHIGNAHWTNTEAEQVCKALNFDTGTAEERYVDKTFYPYLINNVSCQGADSWTECRYQDVVGDVSSDLRPARAFCYNQADLPVYSLYNRNEAHPHYGWVQVSREGTRGRLCSYFYTEVYGVLCRQLGFFDGEEYRGELPDGEIHSEPFWATSFGSCSKDSQNLESCREQPWHKEEEHMYDIYGGYHVKPSCSNRPIKAFCYDQAARVHSGYFNTSGVLQVAYHQAYRPVCAKRDAYTQADANVVCHNLTNSRTSSAIMMRKNVFVFESQPTVKVNFSCQGTEQDLDQCMTVISTSSYNYDCSYDELMVAVLCYEGRQPADGITEWSIGVQDSVLVKRFGLWGHVCSYNWTDNEAAAVCRTLGHYSGVAITDDAYGTRLAAWVDSMSCPAGAGGVSECSITLKNYSVSQGPDYSTCYLRRAKCFEKWQVPTMFLVDNATLSSTRPQGRVAVTYNGTTGYFCSSSTASEIYSTLCRLMGYSRGGEALSPNTTSLPVPHTYPMAWQADLSCGPWTRNVHYVTCASNWNLQHMQEDFQEMWHGAAMSTSWCQQNVPAVSCFDEEHYRLIPFHGNRTQGLLVVWNEGTRSWETVCRSRFWNNEANAACRQLGFSGGRLIPEYDSSINSYTTSQLRYRCSGMAGEKLSSCSTSTEYCMTGSPVWIGCNGTS